MATAKASVYIGGTEYRPYHVQVEQRFDDHSPFEITVSTEKAHVMGGAMKAAESVIIDNAIALAGEVAEITIDRSSGTFNFKGYITNVQIEQNYAGDAFIIFRGYSPTYLLDAQASVKTYEECTLEDIFQDVVQGFPENVSKNIQPVYNKPVPYISRYKETQYQFLSRLAATYGEWFFYDGQELIFGQIPDGGPKTKLKFGSDSMLSFNYGVDLKASGYKQQSYIYQDNAVVANALSDFSPGWLDSHSKTARQKAKSLFTEEGLQPLALHVKDDQHLKYLGEIKKSSITGQAMTFRGQSADPSLCLGRLIEVSSRNGLIGAYRVVSAVHQFDSNHDYNNVFHAIPHSTEVPPARRQIVIPQAEPQVAVVTDNNDPEKLGRVRVQFKWQEGNTPWIRLLTNHAGEDRGEGVYGTYFVPEIGDEVMVEFEQGHPDRPYVLGSFYHGSIPSEFANADNNLKSIKTRTGHTLLFDDTAGQEQIHVTDKNGNFLTIDTAGDTITINAGEHISIKAGTSIAMEAGDQISISAGNSISLSSTNVSVGAANSVSIAAANGYSLTSMNKMEVVQKAATLISKTLTNRVKDDITNTAKNIQSSASDSISSKAKDKIIMSAKKHLDQRGGKVDILTKSGKLKMKAKSNVEIKGKQVKTN